MSDCIENLFAFFVVTGETNLSKQETLFIAIDWHFWITFEDTYDHSMFELVPFPALKRHTPSTAPTWGR